MRRTFSVILHVIAGFFIYGVSVAGFMKVPPPAAKWIIVLVFLVLAAIFLAGGLAIMRFRNWKRDTGIVLLSASGFTAFGVFTFACMLMSEEFRVMMPPETMNAFSMFSDYITGGLTIVAPATLGFMLLRADKATTFQGT